MNDSTTKAPDPLDVIESEGKLAANLQRQSVLDDVETSMIDHEVTKRNEQATEVLTS